MNTHRELQHRLPAEITIEAITRVFLVESEEALDRLEDALVALEGRPDDSEAVNDVFPNLRDRPLTTLRLRDHLELGDGTGAREQIADGGGPNQPKGLTGCRQPDFHSRTGGVALDLDRAAIDRGDALDDRETEGHAVLALRRLGGGLLDLGESLGQDPSPRIRHGQQQGVASLASRTTTLCRSWRT